eukprot:CAMPEP_0118959676 /NCGR_PEP_ID=MMETSP1169-20130426/63252_1 /TAXON_ID=36882 /ORGANISM="Pyramimonas obovata, Strain CCMP722" /LENGTH=53 /DNA_ID=CAMNT_0006907815 /DNA_START=919 /DNA_END=1080 /DNA_ORIENTATION=+
MEVNINHGPVHVLTRKLAGEKEKELGDRAREDDGEQDERQPSKRQRRPYDVFV